MDREAEGMLLALLSGLNYALFMVIGKTVAEDYPPVFFAALSVFIGFLAVLLVALAQGRPFAFSQDDWMRGVATGFFTPFMAIFLFFLGIPGTGSIDAVILLQSELVFSLAVGYFLAGEAVTKMQVAYSLLVLLGIVTVLFKGAMPSLSVSALLILVSPLFYPLGSATAKPLLKRHPLWHVLCVRMFFGCVFLFAAAALFERAPLPALDSGLALDAAFQGIVIMAAGHAAWYLSIGRINISKASACISATPLFALFFAWLLRGEVPTLQQLFGVALVVAGVALIAFKVKSLSRKQQ